MLSVLIVDDSPTVRLTLARAVRAARPSGVRVIEAEDPSRALKLFNDGSPDIVFLDMVFPDERASTAPDREAPEAGLAILKDMLAARPEVPIVLVTGLPGNHPDVVDSVNLGAAGCLRKPVRVEDVKAMLELVDPDAQKIDYIM